MWELQEYSKRIGLREVMTLQELIDSHNSLRNNHIANLKCMREATKEAYDDCYAKQSERWEGKRMIDLNEVIATLEELYNDNH